MIHYVYLHEGFADWEIAFLLPELQAADQKVVTFGLTKEPLRSMAGFLITPDASIDEVNLKEAAGLILPGGRFWMKFDHAGFESLVREALATDKVVAGICNATFYFARLGLLNDRAHAGAPLEFYKEMPGYTGDAHWKDELSVREGKFVTASGLGAIEFTVKTLEAFGTRPASYLDSWYKAFKQGSFFDWP